ncbi:MAG TPA: histidine kinase [Actinophytocola sp.]|jgi:signal transduction histidine kinase|nr:histidine kinase [Actinophytocola sp.]
MPVVAAATAVGVLAGVTGLTLKLADGSHDPADTALSVLGGFLFLGAGMVAQLLRPANRTGLLMVLVGIAFFAEDLQLSRTPAVFTLGLLLAHASTPLVVHLLLAFPHGRLTTRPARVITGAAYCAVLVFSVLAVLFVDRAAITPGLPDNLLLVAHLPVAGTVFGHAFDVVGVVVAVGVIASLLHRYLTGDRAFRVPITPALLVATIAAAASATGSALGSTNPLHPLLTMIYQVAFCLWPLAFLLGALWVRPTQAALTDLLVAAQRPASAARLRATLAEVLRDPSLRLGLPAPDGAFVGTDGDPVDPHDETALLLTGHDGDAIGVLTRREAPWQDARLAAAAAALAGVVLDNQKLAAEASARLAEVHASRVRLVTAADDERRRVERDLHDGAQQRLVTVALGIELARRQVGACPDAELVALLDATAQGMSAAIDELRELARGIHPVLLTEAGLGPAVAELADRVPLPVHVSAADLLRLSAPVEATAYFVVAEALTNVLKHAAAGRVDVRLTVAADRLRVEVADDGVGGVAVTDGSGLGGLRDRVHALDGELTVHTEPGAGTTVTADIPTR